MEEFWRACGVSRKSAIRKRSGPPPGRKPEQRVRRGELLYGSRAISILYAVCEAAGYPWSVRLKALLPLWLPGIRKRSLLLPEIEKQLLRISPRQIDRRLSEKKRKTRAHIEQKNWTHVRKLFGWDRYDVI